MTVASFERGWWFICWVCGRTFEYGQEVVRHAETHDEGRDETPKRPTVEYRVVWKREGQRRKATIRQTLAGAQRKVDYLQGDFDVEKDGGYGGVIHVPGADWLDDLGVPPLEYVRIEQRPVGVWMEAKSD